MQASWALLHAVVAEGQVGREGSWILDLVLLIDHHVFLASFSPSLGFIGKINAHLFIHTFFLRIFLSSTLICQVLQTGDETIKI